MHYAGSFPLLLNAWEDDIATPDTLDGYIAGNAMSFKWYDASTNTEAEFVMPPGIFSADDDPVAPTHSGFGRGAYGSRSFWDGVQAVTQMPQTYKLGQNYPNPFNAATVIPLELPERSSVQIELFNLKGQSMGVIYEDVQNAGWPKIHFDASGLASGIYFCRVGAKGLERGGTYASTIKMLLLK